MCTLDKKRNPQYIKFEVSHDRKQGYVHYFGYTEEDQFKVEDSDISKTLGSFIFPEAQSPRHLHFLTMEEWDLLVPCGKTSLVEIKKRSLLRLTYITLVDGESMEHESVKLFLKKEAWKEKRMMGTLDTKRIPQHTFDLFFNKNFEVSHHRTQDSVHYFGFIKDSQGASTSHDASAAGRKPKKPNKNTTFKFA